MISHGILKILNSQWQQISKLKTRNRFPQYLREKVQSGLALAWTFKAPLLQKTSPAQLVSSTLYRVLGSLVQQYTYVDFCAGAGGPTPIIEQELNKQLQSCSDGNPANSVEVNGGARTGAVKFVLTDLHPHIKDWTEAAKNSPNLSFVSKSVDAANAPSDLIENDGKKVFRLFNLAFHHFDDKLGMDILRNTLETADGFGYVFPSCAKYLHYIENLTMDIARIFELQERTISSMITITAMGLLMFAISPFYFWRSPGHLFFTYIIPIIPFVLVFDGYISSLRTRTSDEIQALMKECGASTDGWTVKSGSAVHTWPTGYMSYVIGIKE